MSSFFSETSPEMVRRIRIGVSYSPNPKSSWFAEPEHLCRDDTFSIWHLSSMSDGVIFYRLSSTSCDVVPKGLISSAFMTSPLDTLSCGWLIDAVDRNANTSRQPTTATRQSPIHCTMMMTMIDSRRMFCITNTASTSWQLWMMNPITDFHKRHSDGNSQEWPLSLRTFIKFRVVLV